MSRAHEVFAAELRRELMAAAGREVRRRRRRPLLAAGAAGSGVLVAALLLVVPHPTPAAAEVVVRIHDGMVEIRLVDLEHQPEDIEAATREAGLDVSIRAVPVGPSSVGRFVGHDSAGSLPPELRTVGDGPNGFLGFVLPVGWAGELHLLVGAPAAEHEAWARFSDATAPLEALACRVLVGQRAAAIVGEARRRAGLHPLSGRRRRQLAAAHLGDGRRPAVVRLGGRRGPRHAGARGRDPPCASRHPDAGAPTSPRGVRPVTPQEGWVRTVHLDLHDTTTRFALSFAVEAAGWRRTNDPRAAAARVADRLVDRPDAPALDVLVLVPTPMASRRGVDAFTRGLARSVVSATEPAALPDALEAGRRGLNVVSQAVVQAAHGYPGLTPRLERTLLMVVRGRANREISHELGQSEATTKRDIAELLHRFDAPNRVALAATAWRLGLPGDGRP